MRLTKLGAGRERGQAMIFFAILASAMFMMMGLAVEGGRLFVEYRHMQAAADMAALVGAQDLPCPGSLSCDQVKDEAYWCAFTNYYGAGNVPGNGGVGCTSSGTAQSPVSGPIAVKVCVPPMSLSPYDGVNYGTDPSCANPSPSSPGNGFIEVQMTQAVQVPIFNASFTMYTHAIARHGEDTPKDFALTILNPTMAGALSMGGKSSNSLIVVGSVMSDSTSTSGGQSIGLTGNSAPVTCDGGWYTSANEANPGVFSATGASSQFAPPACIASDGQICDSAGLPVTAPPCDNPTDWKPNWPYVPDPYCSSLNPPTASPSTCRPSPVPATPSMSNCSPCTQLGWVYTWSTTGGRDSGSWTRADSLGNLTKDNTEFFPGTYPKGISMSVSSTSNVYFNPGVYTIETGLKIAGTTNICIYGAPACDQGAIPSPLGVAVGNSAVTCGNADFTPTTRPYPAPSSSWYYYCSPWGQWDQSSALGSTASPAVARPVTTVPPTFTDGKTPLNGVTFYMAGDNSNFDMEGSGFADLAFPNPCPGWGAASPGSVPFFDPGNPGQPSGADWTTAFGYSYPAGSLPNQDGVAESGPYVYPNADITLAGDTHCINPSTAPPGNTLPVNAGNEWTEEFGSGGSSASPYDLTQHMHFLVFARSGTSVIKLVGSSNQNYWGIVYNPGDPTAYGTSGCGTTPSNCTIAIGGSAGTDGPPMMVGQVVGDNFGYSGSAVVELFYRPCSPKDFCLAGPGSGLVQ